MKEEKESLYDIFINLLKNDSNDIAAVYYHLFDEDICDKDFLQFPYECFKGLHPNICHQEDWFWYFHKSIRQTDFYSNLESYRRNNKLDETQKIRRNELISQKAISKNTPDADELRKLNDLLNSTDEVSICGILSSVLWNMIHVDKDEFLFKTMKRTFLQYDLELNF